MKHSNIIFVLLAVFLLLPLRQTHAALVNATAVFGQTDFISAAAPNPPTATSLSNGSYTALDSINHRLFVVDQSTSNRNSRVLVYPLDSNNNWTTTTASYVFGQTDFISNIADIGTHGNQLHGPHGVAYDETTQRLYVSDLTNGRVLIYDASPATLLANGNGENATYILGQPDWTTGGFNTTRSSFRNPRGLALDTANHRLFVGDGTNDRVMIFDVSDATLAAQATGSGTAEDAMYEIGQPDFVTHTASTTRSLMSDVAAVNYDPINQRLFVNELANNRVMIFDVSPATLASVNPGFGQSENASYVIGQSDFVTGASHLTQTGFTTPRGNTYDPVNGRLFVSDSTRGRVMVFDASPANLASANPGFGTALPAENVLGQSDYTSSTTATTQSKFGIDPLRGLTYNPANNTLFVVDGGNNRGLEFFFIRITSSASIPAGTIGSSYTTSAVTTTASQGTTQTFSLASGPLPSGLSFNTANGVISGSPLVAGTFNITVEADDNFSTGAFFDRIAYSLVVNPLIPTVASSAATGMTRTTAVLNGSISTTGGQNPSVRGFNYGPTASYGSLTTESGSFSTGAFSATATGLSCGQTYHFQSYATNTAGTGTSTPDLTFATASCPPVVSSASASIIPPPSLREIAPVTSAGSYAFYSTESGSISSGGGCTASATYAGRGDNAILIAGMNPSCSIWLTNLSGRKSNILSVGGAAAAGPAASAPHAFVFSKSLSFGMRDGDVLELQKYLNSHGALVAQSGPGSPGSETTLFGAATRKALIAFQEAHASDILAPAGLAKGTGGFYNLTRAYVNAHS